MPNKCSLALLLFLGLACPLACASDKAGAESDCAPPDLGETGEPGTCDCTVRPTNDAFCAGQTSLACSNQSCDRAEQRPVESCCVLVDDPGQDPSAPVLVRTTDTDDWSDPSGKPVDVSCFDPAHYPKQGSSTEEITMSGVLRAFSNGCDLAGVKIEVFTVKRTNDPETDAQPDALVGTAVVTDDASEVVEHDSDTCGGAARKDRRYSYAGLPMNTELLIKTSAASGDAWAALYTYNVYVSEDEADYEASTKTYTRELRALVAEDFNTIPTVAIGGTITNGNGVVGGEVHDCGNIRVQNATVDVTTPRKALSYFTDDQEHPLPDNGRVGTGRTALFAAFDIKPGVARVAASGLLEHDGATQLVSLGYFDVRVFPDAVTSLALRGLRPFQVPEGK